MNLYDANPISGRSGPILLSPDADCAKAISPSYRVVAEMGGGRSATPMDETSGAARRDGDQS